MSSAREIQDRHDEFEDAIEHLQDLALEGDDTAEYAADIMEEVYSELLQWRDQVTRERKERAEATELAESTEDELVDASLRLAERERELRAITDAMAQLHQQRDELEAQVNIMEQRASEPVYPHHEHVMFWAHNPGTLPETREERIKRQFGHHMREMRRIHGAK